MNDTRWTSEGVALLVLALLLVAARLYLDLSTSYTSDDAYITYRYAANLAEGKGWVYNSGEKVQGTSSPLYTTILGAVAGIGGADAVPFASKTISLIADVATLLIVWQLLSSLSLLARFISGALLALYPKAVLIGISGMEASLVVALMVLGLYLLARREPTMACLALGLLLLTRFDAIIWIATVIVFARAWREDVPARAISLLLLIFGSWVVFSHLYFGTWVPHSVIAKRVSWSHMFPVFDPMRILLGYLPFQSLYGWSAAVRGVAAVLLLVPPVVESVRLFRRRTWLAVFPAFFLVYNLAFSFGRVLMADWYYLPGYVAYFATLGSLVDYFTARWRFAARVGSSHVMACSFIVIILVVLLHSGARRWADNPAGILLRQNYRLGVWLEAHAVHDSRILLEPIGYVGWESGLYVDDYIGLVSSRIVAYRQRFAGADSWFMQFVKDTQPDYIVFRNWEVPSNRLFHGYGDGLFQSEFDREWFELVYKPVEWNPRAAEEDSVYLVLYQRIGRPSLAGGNVD
jgi:hypothetical protein